MKSHPRAWLALSALALSGILATPVAARTPYDGSWSVVIMTQRGACESAYRFSLAITNGIVSYPWDTSVVANGRVGKGGAVRVAVASGGQRANGAGRLFATSGGGSWQGVGSSGVCSGRWTAQRQ